MAGIYGHWNWRRAVAESKLDATSKHVLLTLSLFASDAGEGVFPSLRVLCDLTSRSEPVVKRVLRNAEASGWIEREARHAENGRQKSNLYHLTLPEGGRGSSTTGEGVAHDRGEGVAHDPPIPLKGLRRNGQLSLVPEEPPEPDRMEVFDRMWAECRKGSKKKALEQFKRKVPKVVSAQTIELARTLHVKAAKQYEYVKSLELWIRDERWTEWEEQIDKSSQEPAGSLRFYN